MSHLYPFIARNKLINNDTHMFATMSPLLLACHNKNTEEIKFLIKTCKVNTEKLVTLASYEEEDNISFSTVQTKKYQLTYETLFDVSAPVLWHACRSFRMCVIKTLVECGANVNGRSDSRLSSTPLM